jgi:copper chaperone CopZ
MADTGAAVPDAVPGHKYQFNVSMSCGGCSGAVERVLKKLEGASTSNPCPRSPSYLTPLPHAPHITTSPAKVPQVTEPYIAPIHPPRLLNQAKADNVHAQKTGVQRYEVSLETQTATVFADESLPYDKVLRTIAKTGKKVNSGEADGVAQSVEITAE